MSSGRFLVVLASLALMTNAYASKSGGFRGGNIYDLSSQRKNVLFTLHADLKTPAPDLKVFTSRYVEPNGKVAMTEEASFDHLRLQKYTIRQEQLNEVYELLITGGKMYFSVTKEGEVKRKERDVPTNLIIGPSLVPFIRQHWHEIQDLKTIKAELAVLDRMNTYGFEFVKIRESKLDGIDGVVVQMKPSSPFVSFVVRPTYFTVSADGARILEIKGRMLPKRKVGNHWVDFEGEAVFTY